MEPVNGGRERAVRMRKMSVHDEEMALVVEIQRLRVEGRTRQADRLTGDLVTRLRPILVRAAKRSQNRWGSLTLEDLVQVGAIEVLKAVSTFDPAKRGNQVFATWVYFRAYKAITDQTRMHSADVCVSHGAQRGRTKTKAPEGEIKVFSRDRDARHPEGEDANRSISKSLGREKEGAEERAQQEPQLTAEDLLSEFQEKAELRRAVYALPAQQREVVCWFFGIGREAMSVREISRQMNAPRSRVDSVLQMALASLREELE